MKSVLFLFVTCVCFARNPAFTVWEWFRGPSFLEIEFKESLEDL